MNMYMMPNSFKLDDFSYAATRDALGHLKGRIGFNEWWGKASEKHQNSIFKEIKSIIEKHISATRGL